MCPRPPLSLFSFEMSVSGKLRTLISDSNFLAPPTSNEAYLQNTSWHPCFFSLPLPAVAASPDQALDCLTPSYFLPDTKK